MEKETKNSEEMIEFNHNRRGSIVDKTLKLSTRGSYDKWKNKGIRIVD